MRVKLINRHAPDGRVHWSLTVGREYTVIGIGADDYRIVDDGGDPYLFDAQCFVVTDPTEPDFWCCDVGEDGERYCYPEEFGQPGFFEDYFDGNEAVRRGFFTLYRQLYEGAEPGRGEAP
jgi:hypothetical protein